VLVAHYLLLLLHLLHLLLLLRPQGQVLVHGADEDTVFEAAIDAGADDVQPVFDEEGKPTEDFKVRLGVQHGITAAYIYVDGASPGGGACSLQLQEAAPAAAVLHCQRSKAICSSLLVHACLLTFMSRCQHSLPPS
jgi:hypothetical protein